MGVHRKASDIMSYMERQENKAWVPVTYLGVVGFTFQQQLYPGGCSHTRIAVGS